MKYNVIVSERAKRMLEQHMRFLAEKNEEAARRITQDLLDAARSLADMPQRYPFFSHAYIPANKYHKMVVTKYFLLLYQIRDDTVFVDYVVDCRQDYGWLLE